MTNETRIAGVNAFLQGLRELPGSLGQKVIWTSLAGAARPVRERAEAMAPTLDASSPAVKAGARKSGTLKRAIRVSRSKFNRGQNGLYEVIIRVKPLKSAQKKKFKAQSGLKGSLNPDDPYYWWYVEFGTSKMPARPFMRPAFETTKAAQLEGMRKRMAAGIAAQAKKIAAEVNRGKA